MAAGLKTWDANGDVIFDSTVQAGRIVGSVNADSNNGSVSADLSGGIPFAIPVVTGTGDYDEIFDVPNQVLLPQVTVTGNSVSWYRPPETDGAEPGNCIIYYGVY